MISLPRRAVMLVFVLAFLPIFGTVISAQSGPQPDAPIRHELKRVGNGTALATAWSPDGKRIAVVGNLGLWLYTSDLKEVGHFEGNDADLTAVAWSPDSQQIATASGKHEVQLWNATSGKLMTLEKVMTSDSADNPSSAAAGSVSYSPDGSKLASAAIGSQAKIWDTHTGQLLETLPAPAPVYSVAWNPDGWRLAVGGDSLPVPQTLATEQADLPAVASLQVWDTRTLKVVSTLSSTPSDSSPGVPGDLQMIQWFDAGKSLALTASDGNDIVGWDPIASQIFEINIERDCGDTSTGIYFAPDGKGYVVGMRSCETGGWADIYSLKFSALTNWIVMTVTVGKAPVRGVAWAPDSLHFVLLSNDGILRLVAPPKTPPPTVALSSVRTVTDFQPRPNEVFWSNNGARLISLILIPGIPGTGDNGAPGPATILTKDNITDQTLIQNSFEDSGLADPLQISHDHKKVAQMGNEDCGGEIFVYRFAESVSTKMDDPTTQLTGRSDSDCPLNVSAISWSPDDSRLAGAVDGGIVIWDAPSGKIIKAVKHATNPYIRNQLTWSPDGRYVLSYTNQSEVTQSISLNPLVIDSTTGTVVFSPNIDTQQNILDARWSPNGRSLAIVGGDNVISLWKMPTFEPLHSLSGQAIEWGPDGAIVAIATHHKSVQLYQSNNSQLIVEFTTPDDVTALSFSPDGKALITCEEDGTIHLWDTPSGKLRLTLSGHQGSIASIVWKPDSTQFATLGTDNTLRLWDAGLQ